MVSINRAVKLFAVIMAIVSLAGCASLSERTKVYAPADLNEQEYGLTTIETDTVWSGRINITGDVMVKEGATLTVMPGTVVRFDTIEPKLDKDGGRNMLGLDSPYFPGAEIIIRGRLVAVGTADNPITFTSADASAKPGSWGAINLLGSNGNVVEYCRVYYAYNGVHNHASTAVVLNSVFSYNGTALSFKKADFNHPCWMFIEHNRIVENKSGISCRNSIANVAFNDISNNEFFGIWIREGTEGSRFAYNTISGNAKGIYLYKAPKTSINYNNILANSEYNIAMAEENPDSVDASNNWWGTTDPKAIELTIYDHAADEALGTVAFQPVMDHKVYWDGE